MRLPVRPVVGLLILSTGSVTALPATQAFVDQRRIDRPTESVLAMKTPKPKPPPKIQADPTLQGTVVTGLANSGNRFPKFPSSSKKPAPKPSGSERRNPTTDPTGLTVSTENDDFRVTIGICGHVVPAGGSPGLDRCLPALDEPDQTVEPEEPGTTPSTVLVQRIPRPEDVTWGQVLSEVKDVVFPQLTVKVQPAGRTLVNLDTIVYTDRYRVYSQTVTVLGFPVEVQAAAASYTWNFGDGTTLTTKTPGNPYPSKDITHKYMKRRAVSLTLTVNYEAQYNVANTGWRYIGTVPITGPATALQVREAVPVLVEPGR